MKTTQEQFNELMKQAIELRKTTNLSLSDIVAKVVDPLETVDEDLYFQITYNLINLGR